MADKRKIKILFLCTGNSCRSQMAEGWARHLRGNEIEAFSAGIQPQGLNPLAVRVMAEAGVDISGQRPKRVQELAGVEFDYVVTVCDRAQERCPVFPSRARVVHVGFDDPPVLAREARTEQQALDCYRRVRDEIRAFVEQLPGCLTDGETAGEDASPSPGEGALRGGTPGGAAGSLYSKAMEELVAIGAAIGANSEHSLREHLSEAIRLNVPLEDVAWAIATARNVKESAAAAILRAAGQHLAAERETQARPPGACCSPGAASPPRA